MMKTQTVHKLFGGVPHSLHLCWKHICLIISWKGLKADERHPHYVACYILYQCFSVMPFILESVAVTGHVNTKCL